MAPTPQPAPGNQTVGYTDNKGRVSFINPGSGEYVWIPKDKAQAAADAGFEPETPQQHAQRQEQEEYSTTGAKAEAFLHGAGSAITLGAKDLLTEVGVFHPGHLRKLREHQGGYSTAGEITGTVASALTGKLPLGAISKAVTPLAAKASARIVAGAAEKGAASLAARMGAATARAAIPAVAEGGAVGLQHGITEVALRDRSRDVTAAQIGTHIAKKTLEGAAIGGAFGVGFLGIGAAAKGGVNLTRKLLTAGRRPSDIALISDRLRAAGGEIGGISGAADRQGLVQELNDARKFLKELKSRGNADPVGFSAEVSGIEQQIKIIGGKIRKIDKQLLSPPRGGAADEAIETVTETTRYAQPTAAQQAKRAKDALAKDPRAKPILDQMREASDDEVHAALSDDMARLIKEEDYANEAIKELREAGRGLMREGGIQEDVMYAYRGQLHEARRLIRRRKDYVDRAMDQLQIKGAKRHGSDLIEAGLMPKAKVVKKVVRRKLGAAEGAPAAPPPQAPAIPGVQLSDDLLQELSSRQTQGAVEHLFNWRSAGVLLGFAMGDVTGAILGGVAGSGLARSMLLEPVLMGMASVTKKAAAVAMGASGKLPAGVLPVAALSLAEATVLKSEMALPINEPERVRAQAREGYDQAGMDPSYARGLADYKAGQAELLREHAPTDLKDPAQRLRYARLVSALSNPQAAGARIRALKNVTVQDAIMFRRMFPQQAKAVARLAIEALEDPQSDVPADKRKALQILAYPDFEMRQAHEAKFFQGGYQPQNQNQQAQTRPIAQQGFDQQASTAQRIAQ